ncbi:MAG: cytochrome c3 family protein [Chloroflexi bacterium]|nr:cytochrome c3 family protein [Chloroflexota bacterium]
MATPALARQHPFVSSVGCVTALALMAVLGLAIWFTGGLAFSPGALSARQDATEVLDGFSSHAEFEDQCERCHSPFRGIEAARCEQCHTEVGVQRSSGKGLHAAFDNVARCGDCHIDHKGRAFDLSNVSLSGFDHSKVGFSLDKHGRAYDKKAMNCDVCHTGLNFEFSAASCGDCHGAHDAAFMTEHARAFGSACMNCHDGVDVMRTFDHARAQFPLEGKHGPLECAACHSATVKPKDTPTQCAACHAEPAMHAALFGTDCEACHTSAAWSPATLNGNAFDHAATKFALTSHTENYDGQSFACATCHGQALTPAGPFTFVQQVCSDCHGLRDQVFMVKHVQDFGNDCLSCHDGSGSMKNFDHSRVFLLDGKHATTACADCHPNNKFKDTPRECVSCHAEPDIHLGLFGLQCADCHSTTAWLPAALKNHTFPLDHGEQGEIACATCHPNRYTEYTCYLCHEHDKALMVAKHAEEGITGPRLEECVACHLTGRKEEGGN